MAHANTTDGEPAGLVRRAAEGPRPTYGGIRRSLARIPPADDFTLTAPDGGEPTRGVDAPDGALDALARFFRDGETGLGVVQTHAPGCPAVLVA